MRIKLERAQGTRQPEAFRENQAFRGPRLVTMGEGHGMVARRRELQMDRLFLAAVIGSALVLIMTI